MLEFQRHYLSSVHFACFSALYDYSTQLLISSKSSTFTGPPAHLFCIASSPSLESHSCFTCFSFANQPLTYTVYFSLFPLTLCQFVYSALNLSSHNGLDLVHPFLPVYWLPASFGLCLMSASFAYCGCLWLLDLLPLPGLLALIYYAPLTIVRWFGTKWTLIQSDLEVRYKASK